MQDGQPFRECRNALRWIETENRKGLRRPIIECSIRPKRPTSHMSEAFSFSQIKFASLQFLRRIFLLGDIQCVADQSRDLAVLDDWLSRAVHNPFSLFRMVNPIRHVDANALAKYSLERFGYEIAIVRMQTGQPFGECRNPFRWIETEENERLGRPIIECPIRLERPAPHMGQPFPFTQVKFASLQLLRTPPELFFSALAVLDVDTRSKPLHYLPLFVMKRYVPVQKRTIRSVSAPNTRFYFQRFTASQSAVPSLN